jgi:hypothetical protein
MGHQHTNRCYQLLHLSTIKTTMVAGGGIDGYVDEHPRRLHHLTMIRSGKKVL